VRIGNMNNYSLESILADCQSSDIDRQVSAIWAIRNLKLYEAVSELILLFNSEDDDIRRLAVSAFTDELRNADGTQVGPALIPLIQDPDDLVRGDAIDALASLEYSSALEPVVQALRIDSDWVVRASAAEAIPYLADINNPIALDALEAALSSDPYNSVRSYAASSIGLIAMPSDEWIKKLTRYYETEVSDDTKVGILGARYRLGDNEQLGDMLVDLVKTSDEQLFRIILNVLRDLLRDANIPRKLIEDAPQLCEAIVKFSSTFPVEENHASEVVGLLSDLSKG
jgi:HEAT repeat protein